MLVFTYNHVQARAATHAISHVGTIAQNEAAQDRKPGMQTCEHTRTLVQAQLGLIPVIKGKGSSAKAIADMMQRLRMEMREHERDGEGEIDELILIDR